MEVLAEMVTFDQRLRAAETVDAKALGQGQAWQYSRSTKRPLWLEHSEEEIVGEY